jgi:hypothetical protein
MVLCTQLSILLSHREAPLKFGALPSNYQVAVTIDTGASYNKVVQKGRTSKYVTRASGTSSSG